MAHRPYGKGSRQSGDRRERAAESVTRPSACRCVREAGRGCVVLGERGGRGMVMLSRAVVVHGCAHVSRRVPPPCAAPARLSAAPATTWGGSEPAASCAKGTGRKAQQPQTPPPDTLVASQRPPAVDGVSVAHRRAPRCHHAERVARLPAPNCTVGWGRVRSPGSEPAASCEGESCARRHRSVPGGGRGHNRPSARSWLPSWTRVGRGCVGWSCRPVASFSAKS